MFSKSPLALIILSTLIAFISGSCDPDDCPGSFCCLNTYQCAKPEEQDKCTIWSCEHHCESKCCYGGYCNDDDSQCGSTSKRLKVIIIIVAAACFVSLVCIVYMKRYQARRRFVSRQRASEPNRNRSRAAANSGSDSLNQNNDVYIFQSNQASAPPSPQPLLNFNPRNLGVESGMPFREGSMKSAYELNSVSNIEYGEVSYDQELIKKANQKAVGKEAEKGVEQGKQEEGDIRPASSRAISLGDFMLKAEYQFDDGEGNNSGHLSDIAN